MTDVARLLRFGSKKHVSVCSALNERWTLADHAMEDRRETWSEQEDRYIAYLPATTEDKTKAANRAAGLGPQSTTLIIPMSYALVMTWYTYMATVMLGRAPVHQWEGRTTKGEKGKLSVETLMDYQTRVGEHVVPYHVWTLDTGKYGLGVLGYHWADDTSWVTESEDVPITFAGVPVGGGQTRRVDSLKELPGYEGNRLYNIHPSKVLFDPRVPLSEYQRGEFLWVNQGSTSKGDMLTNEDYFNKDILEDLTKDGTLPDTYRSEQLHLTEENLDTYEPEDAMSIGSVEPELCYVRLVPKHWGLGPAEHKELWVFTTVADRTVIIGARPLGNYNQKFPIRIQEHEPDGHQLTKRSFLEIVGPMQDFLDWLLNTHRLNVEKAINDTLIVDPSLVYMSDVRDPGAGKLIRARPRAYGRGILDQAIHQVQVQDVTQQHLATTSLVIDMMQRVSGITEQVMGVARPSSRRSAAEIQTGATFGINRLKTEAEYLGASAWGPLAQDLLQNTQQWMSRETQLRLIADDAALSAADVEKFANITPEDIQGFYDYVPVDGSLPIDRQAQGQTLIQLMGAMGQTPGVLQSYDMGGVFGWVAELMGAKGLKNFKIQLSEDEIIKRQLADGNIVKAGDAPNAVDAGDAGGAFLPPSGPLTPDAGGEGGGDTGGAQALEIVA